MTEEIKFPEKVFRHTPEDAVFDESLKQRINLIKKSIEEHPELIDELIRVFVQEPFASKHYAEHNTPSTVFQALDWRLRSMGIDKS